MEEVTSNFLPTIRGSQSRLIDGIQAQADQASNTEINATNGQAFEFLFDDGTRVPMRLPVFADASRVVADMDLSVLYAPRDGIPELRDSWLQEIFFLNPDLVNYGVSRPVVTAGITHGIYAVSQILVDPGDTVVAHDLMWDDYRNLFPQARFDHYSLFANGELNIDGFADRLSGHDQRKTVLFTFPDNPTGYMPNEDEMGELTDVLVDSAERGNKIMAVCDDAYAGFVYEPDIPRKSLFASLADIHENILAAKVDGLTKFGFYWGLRVGFVTYTGAGIKEGDLEMLENRTVDMIEKSILKVATPNQLIALNAIRNSDFHPQRDGKVNILRQRYEKVGKILGGHPEYGEHFTPFPFNSGYYVSLQLRTGNAETVRRGLIDNFSTGVIRIGNPDTSNTLRVAYCALPERQLPNLFANIDTQCRRMRR